MVCQNNLTLKQNDKAEVELSWKGIKPPKFWIDTGSVNNSYQYCCCFWAYYYYFIDVWKQSVHIITTVQHVHIHVYIHVLYMYILYVPPDGILTCCPVQRIPDALLLIDTPPPDHFYSWPPPRRDSHPHSSAHLNRTGPVQRCALPSLTHIFKETHSSSVSRWMVLLCTVLSSSHLGEANSITENKHPAY